MDREDLEEILKEHQLWLFDRRMGKRADLSEVNLGRVDLQESKLGRANLRNVGLAYANLNGAELQNANLRFATLDGAYLQDANLNGADLQDARLVGVNLRGSILEKSNLVGTNLVYSNLNKASLYLANLVNADLHGARLEGANLKDANLEDANLKDAKFRDANLQGANLRGANLKEANLQRADLSETDLQGADLRGANCADATFKATKLKGANLSFVNINGSRIDKETLLYMPKYLIDQYKNSIFVLGYVSDDGGNYIVRSIEFPPEYHQAGISILNYFATVLRKKYPDHNAKVRIEQEGLKVTMVVESKEGDREIIEQALDEYGLVIAGHISLDEYTDDKLLITDLKNQLLISKTQIEMQRNLLEYQDAEMKKKDVQINSLLDVVGLAVQNPSHSYITVKPKTETHLTLNMQFLLQVSPMIQGNLNELNEQLQVKSEATEQIQDLQDSIQNIEKSNSPDEVKTSPTMSKFRRFLEDLGDDKSKMAKTIKGVKNGVRIAQDLAKHYNDIAQWCGLPQVPEPFLGGDKK